MEATVLEKTFKITIADGLHARPCTWLVSSISSYQSEVQLIYNDRSVNLKSIMGVMSLAVPEGACVTVSAKGEDAEELLLKVTDVLISKGLGEAC